MAYINLLTALENIIQKVKNAFTTIENEDLSLYSDNKVKYTICPNGNTVDGVCTNCTCRPYVTHKKTEESI